MGKSDTLGVYKIDSKPAHLDILSKVTMFEKNRTKFVTASSDGDLKVRNRNEGHYCDFTDIK